MLREVHIVQADLVSFRLARGFPLILLPCNTFSTLSIQERLATLAQVCNHLLPGGLFTASLPNSAVLSSLPEHGETELEEVFNHPESGDPVQVSSSWERTGQEFTLSWHYDILSSEGSVQRFTVQTRHHLTPVEVYLSELEQAGLTIVAMYGDFDRSEFNRHSSHLILAAKKPSP